MLGIVVEMLLHATANVEKSVTFFTQPGSDPENNCWFPLNAQSVLRSHRSSGTWPLRRLFENEMYSMIALAGALSDRFPSLLAERGANNSLPIVPEIKFRRSRIECK